MYALEYSEKFKLVYASGNGMIAVFKVGKRRVWAALCVHAYATASDLRAPPPPLR